MKPIAGIATAAAVWAALCPIQTSAATYLYSYVGNDFTNPKPPFTTSDFISLQFISTGALGPNLSDQAFAAPITSWSLSVGPLSYNQSDGVLYSINFSTDSSSHITGYQFTTQTNVVVPGLLPWEYPPTPYVGEVFSFDLPPTFGVADAIYIPRIAQDSYYTYNENNPGTWTITDIPEPPAWAFLLTGFAGLGATGVRKRRKTVPV